MKKNYLVIMLSVLFFVEGYAQSVAINADGATPDAKAILDVKSTTKGILIPRMTTAERMAIPSPVPTGLLVYDNTTSSFWYYAGGAWQSLAAGWSLTGNTGTSASNFIGTTDFQPLRFRVGGEPSGLIDWGATGTTSLGYLANANNTANATTAIGYTALYRNTGYGNTAVGNEALLNNNTGAGNTAMGARALRENTTGTNNTGLGFASLSDIITGEQNTAVGYQAMAYRTGGNYNTGVGSNALVNNASGEQNTAIGYYALSVGDAGSFNTAAGNTVLFFNRGSYNTGMGVATLYNNQGGSNNTAYGYNALRSNQTGNNNTAIGNEAGTPSWATNLDNTTTLGNGAMVFSSNTVRIGNTAVTSIGGQVGWTTLSDVRFKKDIHPSNYGLNFIMQLEPVTYRMDVNKLNRFLYGKKADSLFESASSKAAILKKESIIYSGFSAQQVEEAAARVGYNFSAVHKPENENDHYALDYAQFVVPVIKAIQEQQQLIEQLIKDNKELKKEIERLKQRR